MSRPLKRAAISSCAWGVLAATALLWPARLASPLDGIPLDQPLEAIAVGLIFPALWWFFPQVLLRTTTRALIVALVVWKGLLAAAIVQDGWCIRFNPPAPIAKDAPGAPHSWDLRADWQSPDPACSAIVTRQYEGLGEFPAWFFNLPPASDSWPVPTDTPPGATTPITVSGYLRADAPGTLAIEIGHDMEASLVVDGREFATSRGGRLAGPIAPGLHAINIRATLAGMAWKLVAEWDGADLWNRSIATVRRPATIDHLVRPWGRWIAPILALALIAAWSWQAIRSLNDPDLVTWSLAASLWFGILGMFGHDELVRWSIPLLATAALMPVRGRVRGTARLFFLLGIPWLTMIAALFFRQIGQWRLYGSGNDYWTFQRAAYRIVMLGYWLEGGSLTFWFQPLYRWIAGLLHVVFGDSSVGEVYWDAASAFAGATFAFAVARQACGYVWGIFAAVLVLTLFSIAVPWAHIGLGLSEISSMGLLSLAALLAMRSRRRPLRVAFAAGVFASLAFYTRLNNLPMAFGTAAFALLGPLPAAAIFRPRALIRRSTWRPAAVIGAVIVGAVLLFAWRTWHYTGVFSVTYGTQAGLLAVVKPGMTRVQGIWAMASSAMMVVTMHDPPRVDVYSMPMLIGAAAALAALAGVPRLRNLPLAPVLFCLSGLVGSLVARGNAYEGRFTFHIIPITSALAVCAIAALVDVRSSQRTAVELADRAERD